MQNKADSESSSKNPLVSNFLTLAKEFYQRFNETECLMRASALAFTGIFSLIPLLLLGLALLGFFLPSPGEATEYLQKVIVQFLPGREAATYAKETLKLIGFEEMAEGLRKSSVVGVIIGSLVQLWTGISLFSSIASSLNLCFGVKETRSFLRLRIICLGVFLGVLLLFLVSLIPSFLFDFVLNLPFLQGKITVWDASVINAVLATVVIFIDIGIFVLIYQILPDTKVPFRAAVIGGSISGILWEIFKRAFSLYLSHFGNYSKLYGSLGTVALLITWISYTCIILLSGGVVCKMVQERLEVK